jgi:hypothetical protein
MTDQFDSVMSELLSPIEKLSGRVDDSLYFLRRDGCFVYTHGYHHPTPGSFIGKIIHYPSPTGDDKIWGRQYAAIHKVWVDGEHKAIQNDVQYKQHFVIDPSIDPKVKPPLVAKYVFEFPLKDFRGFFEPHFGLLWCSKKYSLVKTWVEQTAELMDFPPEKMGVTGSLSYGVIEEADMDFDVIFRGTLEENERVRQKLYELAAQPGKMVHEFGRDWPIRIYWKDYLLCPFFVFQKREDAPLADAQVEPVREGIEGTAVVGDDFFNSYLPILVGLTDVKIGGRPHEDVRLFTYDGSLRGEFRSGDRIWFQGRLLNVKTRSDEYRAVAVDINFDIKNISG